MNDNDHIKFSLDWTIRNAIPSIAVMGDLRDAKKVVEDALFRANKKSVILDARAMPSVDEVNSHRRGQCFFEAFFEMQGIKTVPEVLIIDRFNHRPPKETYFIKSLLNRDCDYDQTTREYLSGLKQIILILDRLDSPGAYGLDNSIQTSIVSCIDLDAIDRAN